MIVSKLNEAVAVLNAGLKVTVFMVSELLERKKVSREAVSLVGSLKAQFVKLNDS